MGPLRGISHSAYGLALTARLLRARCSAAVFLVSPEETDRGDPGPESPLAMPDRGDPGRELHDDLPDLDPPDLSDLDPESDSDLESKSESDSASI